MSGTALDILRRRVEALDAGPASDDSPTADPRLAHFVSVLSSCTNTQMAEEFAESGGPALLRPAEADEATRRCRLLTAVAREEEGLVAGPLRRSEQCWIASGPAPAASRLLDADRGGPHPPSTKPFGLGLFTSTRTRRGDSMWQMYLDPYRGSDLFPLPWYSWRLTAAEDSRIRELASAADWVGFVEEYARPGDGLLHPDWARVAADHDGVHMTLAAIVATQGFRFQAAGGVTAAPYWDVESTLWLRWVFAAVEEI
ncbi:hypothetical protein [Kitasatospora mediocidica]|uniref:hypothetical protein n=1 Tax=Kitasatospora mediocidica TaxID=58352 RepID=UPI00055B4DA2|nr:hypothetical protein [Kitasatospora mediocidica]